MKLGRAKRIFGVALECASAELRKIKEGKVFEKERVDLESASAELRKIKEGNSGATENDGLAAVLKATVVKAMKAMDKATAPARENLASLIVAAYIDVVQFEPDDMVSFVFLSEMSLLTLSNDVKEMAGSKQHVGGVALGLVVDLVATGDGKSSEVKAMRMLEYFKDNFKKESVKEKASKIHAMTNQYKKKLYRGIMKVKEIEAVVADAGRINGDETDKWVVELPKLATTLSSLRSMEYGKIEQFYQKNDVSPINQEKINSLYAGTTGGGDVPHARKNLVEAGFSVKHASAIEQADKEVRSARVYPQSCS